jgi:ethanolamine utilization protein EutN
MRIAEVFGTVTLSQSHPSMAKGSFRLAQPLSAEEILAGKASPAAAETLVVWDDLGAGDGSMIAVSEGPEAAQPFRPEIKPADAYNAAILDHIDIDPV